MDVVYVYKSRGDSRELRYSLRSLKNVKHDRVFIVGDREDWFKDIVHIPHKTNQTPFIDVLCKVEKACLSDVSDDFIMMNDDFYITEPTEIEPLYREIPKPVSYHKRSVVKTLDYLNMKDAKNYELHAPMVFNKHKLKSIVRRVRPHMLPIPIFYRTVYGNVYNIGGEFYEDKKSYRGEIPKGKFISTSRYFHWLDEMFPDKSNYEN